MADDQKSLTTAFNEQTTTPTKFSIRTMKQDIERLRQGLPLKDVLVSTADQNRAREASRKLTASVTTHSADEHPPKESATVLPKQDHRPVAPAAPPKILPPKPSYKGPVPAPSRDIYAIPVRPSASAPVLPSTPLTRREGIPIETMKAKARPTPPPSPRGGTIKIEADSGSMGKADSFLRRLFPTRKRIVATAIIALLILVAGSYVLFAYFGRPLPGTKFIIAYVPLPERSATATPTPAASPLEPTPTPSAPAASPTPEASPTPTRRPATIRIDRLARTDLAADATTDTLVQNLSKFSIMSHTPGDFTRILVQHKESSMQLTTKELFLMLGIKIPEDLLGELSDEPLVYFYAPRDIPEERADEPAHLCLAIPISGSVPSVRAALTDWESTLGGDLAILALTRQVRPGTSTLFTTNAYQGVTVRYQNIPDPLMAADYAIYEGTEPPQLLFTTSRESMYATIGSLNFLSE